MKLYKKMTNFWKIFLIFNLIGLSTAGILEKKKKKIILNRKYFLTLLS